MSSKRSPSKGKREPTAWVNYVRSVYQELKAADPSTKYKEAMLEASKRKRADPAVLSKYGGHSSAAKKSPKKSSKKRKPVRKFQKDDEFTSEEDD
jgi:hypothetical protein